jgi:hypothetical protein
MEKAGFIQPVAAVPRILLLLLLWRHRTQDDTAHFVYEVYWNRSSLSLAAFTTSTFKLTTL